MDNFKECSRSKIASRIVIRDLTDDKIILDKMIKNVLPDTTKEEHNEQSRTH